MQVFVRGLPPDPENEAEMCTNYIFRRLLPNYRIQKDKVKDKNELNSLMDTNTRE